MALSKLGEKAYFLTFTKDLEKDYNNTPNVFDIQWDKNILLMNKIRRFRF